MAVGAEIMYYVGNTWCVTVTINTSVWQQDRLMFYSLQNAS